MPAQAAPAPSMRTCDSLTHSGYTGVFCTCKCVLSRPQAATHSTSTSHFYIISCDSNHIISHPSFSISLSIPDFIHLLQHIMCSSGAQIKNSRTNCHMLFFAPRWMAEILLCPYNQSLHHAGCLCFSADDYTGTDTLVQMRWHKLHRQQYWLTALGDDNLWFSSPLALHFALSQK